MIIDEIRELARSPNFMPFSIELNDGRSIPVPSRDHIATSQAALVVVLDDDGVSGILYARNISSVTVPADNEASSGD
jgi:hypothetical protein